VCGLLISQNKQSAIDTIISEKNFPALYSGDSAQLYKCQIYVFGKYYSGLLMNKKTGENQGRIVFVTELGMRMFEMEVNQNEFLPIYFFEPLNKEKYKKILSEDLSAIFMLPIKSGKVKYKFLKTKKVSLTKKQNNNFKYRLILNNGNPELSHLLKGIRKKLIIRYDNKENGKLFTYAKLKHKGFLRIRIILNKINKTAN
jgi:hypothetical protein